MNLVNITYDYVNRFINCNDLLTKLKEIDTTTYTKEEINDINELIENIKKTIETTPNEIDKIEKNRIKKINFLLEKIKTAQENTNDTELKQFLKEKYNSLLKDKKIKKDGGKLYQKIFNLITNNKLYLKNIEKINNKQLLKLITQYISAPNPPRITQETFEELVKTAIEEGDREALWRLAFNYNKKNKDFSSIENYFIKKRDDYYLIELNKRCKRRFKLKRINK